MQPTGHLGWGVLPPSCHCGQIGALLLATLKNLRTSRIESAAFGNGIEARHGAINLVQAFTVNVHVWNRRHQAHGVRVLRMVDHLVHRPNLGNAPGIHDGHTVACFGNHTHVVRDEHHGCTAFFANVFQEANDLRLNGHVQCCGGLIGHNQLGLSRQGQGNDHPLTHATRELVRVMVNALGGGWNAGVLQQANGTLPRFLI